MSRVFLAGGWDTAGGVASATEFEDRECGGTGGISGSSSLSDGACVGVASNVVLDGAGEVAWLIADDAEGAMAGGRFGLPKLRRRFSIGAYPAVSPRMKLIATNKNPKMAN